MLTVLLFLAAQDPAARAQAWIHDGLPAPPAAADRELLNPESQHAWDLALLAPARTSGFEPAPELFAAAVARALEAWLAGELGAFASEASARLSGVLGAEGARRLSDALRGDEAAPGEDAIAALLKSQPFEYAAAPILAAALDEEVHPSVRGDLAVFLLLAQGRTALDALAPALLPDADDRFMRQVFTAWRPIVSPADLPVLERLAREGQGSAAQHALQLWSRAERDPARRLAAYELALRAPGAYTSLALDALAEGGPHPEIADRLRGVLRGGTATQRGAALRALALFDSPQAVLDAYRALEHAPSAAAAGWWMPALALSPLPEARQAAADWLAEGGIGNGATAQVVIRALSPTDTVLPLLGILFAAPELPEREKLPLALTTAARSAEALDYLRQVARVGSGFEQQQAVSHLVAAGTAADLAWVEEIVRADEFAAPARAAALEALCARELGDELLDEWLAQPPADWELQEAAVRLAIETGSEAQRDRAFALARGGVPGADEDGRMALRSAAWMALANRGDPAGFELLAEEWRALLEELAPEGRDGARDWRDLYDLLHEWPALESCARAARVLAAGVPHRPASAALAAWDPDRTAPEVLWTASAVWATVDPAQAVAWLDSLDAHALTPADRMRVRGLRAARAEAPVVERESLRRLLEEPELLREHPILLAQAFAPEGARWTLFHDRIAERMTLAEARMSPTADALRILPRLLDGAVEAEVLLRAARFAASEPGGDGVALDLARRGISLHPTDPELALTLAQLWERHGRLDEARAEWRRVLRLLPAGYPQHDLARGRLGELGG